MQQRRAEWRRRGAATSTSRWRGAWCSSAAGAGGGVARCVALGGGVAVVVFGHRPSSSKRLSANTLEAPHSPNAKTSRSTHQNLTPHAPKLNTSRNKTPQPPRRPRPPLPGLPPVRPRRVHGGDGQPRRVGGAGGVCVAGARAEVRWLGGGFGWGLVWFGLGQQGVGISPAPASSECI